jgi:hypothetical protein
MRDPRLDPQPGDTFRKNGQRRTLITPGSDEDLAEWREWAKDAELMDWSDPSDEENAVASVLLSMKSANSGVK